MLSIGLPFPDPEKAAKSVQCLVAVNNFILTKDPSAKDDFKPKKKDKKDDDELEPEKEGKDKKPTNEKILERFYL